MSIYSVIKDNDLTEVAEVGDYDWNWSITGIYFQRSSGRFFAYSDGGCSCYSYGEDANSLSDLDEVTRAKAIELLKEQRGGTGMSDDDVQREIAKVRDFR